jgi:hypothetical protein
LLHQVVAGIESNVALVAISALVIDTTASLSTAADFENRLYRCVVAGTTAAAQPDNDKAVGEQTIDGGAAFEAMEAWSRSGAVEPYAGEFSLKVKLAFRFHAS